jgi:valacyclovir hydrolase
MPKLQLSTGAELQYEDVGSGDTVILLHGLLGTARVDLGDVIDAISSEFRVIAVTMRGYGESGPKPRSFPPDFYERDASDVLALLDALQLDRVHIGGYSDGGEVALIAAVLQPERFKSVAVWGSVGIVPEELMPSMDDLGTVPGVDDIRVTARELHEIEDPEPVLAEWFESYTSIIQRGGDLSLSRVHQLTMPVLLMVGDADPMAPVPYAERFVNQAPNAQLVLFTGGHAVHQEHPRAFHLRLAAFFKGHA